MRSCLLTAAVVWLCIWSMPAMDILHAIDRLPLRDEAKDTMRRELHRFGAATRSITSDEFRSFSAWSASSALAKMVLKDPGAAKALGRGWGFLLSLPTLDHAYASASRPFLSASQSAWLTRSLIDKGVSMLKDHELSPDERRTYVQMIEQGTPGIIAEFQRRVSALQADPFFSVLNAPADAEIEAVIAAELETRGLWYLRVDCFDQPKTKIPLSLEYMPRELLFLVTGPRLQKLWSRYYSQSSESHNDYGFNYSGQELTERWPGLLYIPSDRLDP